MTSIPVSRVTQRKDRKVNLDFQCSSDRMTVLSLLGKGDSNPIKQSDGSLRMPSHGFYRSKEAQQKKHSSCTTNTPTTRLATRRNGIAVFVCLESEEIFEIASNLRSPDPLHATSRGILCVVECQSRFKSPKCRRFVLHFDLLFEF